MASIHRSTSLRHLLLAATILLFQASKPGSCKSLNTSLTEELVAVTQLREYLRINTAHPAPDYQSAVRWLETQAATLGLDFHVLHFPPPNLFALWMTWNGTDPTLPTILLNSHMDVVAVNPSKWAHDPFDAYKDAEGYIYGRGAVDMKSATVAQLQAVARLKAEGFQPVRTVHLSIMPDEELGGDRGMVPFVASPEFQALNVGVDLDEASSSSEPSTMYVVHAEKTIWQFNFTVTGVGGHGSTLPRGTAAEGLQKVIDRLMTYRDSQLELLSRPDVTMANVTSVNLVQIGGGLGHNIIPTELWAAFDMRIRVTPTWNFTNAQQMLDSILAEVGEGASLRFITKSLEYIETPLDESNVWWTQLQETCTQLNLTCRPDVFSGGTDGGYVRSAGIPVLGLNTFVRTPWIAHQDNESIHEQEFLDGIDRYAAIIRDMASLMPRTTVPPEPSSSSPTSATSAGVVHAGAWILMALLILANYTRR